MPAISALQATPPTSAAPDRVIDRAGMGREEAAPSFAMLLRKETRQGDAGDGKDVPVVRRFPVAGPGREVLPQPGDEKVESEGMSDPESDTQPDTTVPTVIGVAPPVAPPVLPVGAPIAPPPPVRPEPVEGRPSTSSGQTVGVGVSASIAPAPIGTIPIDGTTTAIVAPDYTDSATAFLAQPETATPGQTTIGPKVAPPKPDPAIDAKTPRPARFEEPAALVATGQRAPDPVAARVAAFEAATAPTDTAPADLAAVTLATASTTVHPTGDTAQGSLDLARHDWPQAVIDRIERLRDAADAADTSIRIVPDALGTIDVSVRRQGEVTHVHFAAEQAQTRAMLAEAQPKLVELGEARGLRFGQSSVDAGTAQQQPSPQQQRPTPAAPMSAARASAARSEASTDHRIA